MKIFLIILALLALWGFISFIRFHLGLTKGSKPVGDIYLNASSAAFTLNPTLTYLNNYLQLVSVDSYTMGNFKYKKIYSDNKLTIELEKIVEHFNPFNSALDSAYETFLLPHLPCQVEIRRGDETAVVSVFEKDGLLQLEASKPASFVKKLKIEEEIRPQNLVYYSIRAENEAKWRQLGDIRSDSLYLRGDNYGYRSEEVVDYQYDEFTEKNGPVRHAGNFFKNASEKTIKDEFVKIFDVKGEDINIKQFKIYTGLVPMEAKKYLQSFEFDSYEPQSEIGKDEQYVNAVKILNALIQGDQKYLLSTIDPVYQQIANDLPEKIIKENFDRVKGFVWDENFDLVRSSKSKKAFKWEDKNYSLLFGGSKKDEGRKYYFELQNDKGEFLPLYIWLVSKDGKDVWLGIF